MVKSAYAALEIMIPLCALETLILLEYEGQLLDHKADITTPILSRNGAQTELGYMYLSKITKWSQDRDWYHIFN
jgi:hypothetical protein